MPRPDVLASGAGVTEISQVLIGLGRRMRTGTGGSVLVGVAQAGAHHVAGARWASVSLAHHGHFRTLAATAPVAAGADALQHEIGAGPGVDPAPGEDFYRCGDLARRCRWPVLGSRLHQRLGLASVLSFRLHLIGEPETVAALHLYSDAADAFGDDALPAGGLLAAHGGLAVSAQVHRQRAQHLEQALASTREVSTAVGVLMARYRLTRLQSLEMMRAAAQDSARPMAEIAAEIITSEVLRLPPMPTATPARPRTTPRPFL
jgi:hypothetical protein